MPGSLRHSNPQVQDIFALTPTQQGILYHCLQEPSAGFYRVQLHLSLAGELNENLTRGAWQRVVAANGALRTSFRWEKLQEPVQMVWKDVTPDIRWLDRKEGRTLEQVLEDDWAEGFDLSGVPFRVVVYRDGPGSYAMIVSHHHILYDGWSSGIVLGEFLECYNALSKGSMPPEPAKPSFKSYVAASGNVSPQHDEHKDYWRQYLNQYEPPLFTPPKTATGDFDCKTAFFQLPDSLAEGIESLAGTWKVSAAAILLGVWGILWQKFTYADDVVFGTPHSGRPEHLAGVDAMVGLFIRTVPVRVKANGEDSIAHIVEGVNRHLRSIEAGRSLPLVEIKQCAGMDERREWLDTVVAVENYPLGETLANGDSPIEVTAYQERESTPYRMLLNIETFGGLGLRFYYDSRELDRDLIADFAQRYEALLAKITAQPELKLRGLSLLAEGERQEILDTLSGDRRHIPADETFLAMVSREAERCPGAVALVGSMHYSYSFLQYRRLRFAVRLASLGIGGGSFVAVMMRRTVELPVVLLGILAAGAAYVPMDPNYPKGRLAYMLQDSGAGVLVVDAESKTAVEALDFRGQVLVAGDNRDSDRISPTDLPAVQPEDGAYLIYTSGSTGNPKGILINRRNLVNFVMGITSYIPVPPESSVLALTTVSFDIFFLEMLLPLAFGARVAMATEEEQREPDLLLHTLQRHCVTHLQVTPTRLAALVEHWRGKGIPECVRHLLVGGEAFPPWLSRDIHAYYKGQVYNVYGPTEATVWVTVKKLNGDERLTVGTAICNTGLVVLDRWGDVCPAGWVGELCISGANLATGYYRNQSLTDERFVYLDHTPGRRFYRSGDLARCLPNGEMDILGRIDRQLKLRGFRIELPEIERRLSKHPAVTGALVDLWELGDGQRRLCAYLSGTRLTGDERLREWLAEFLPDYMLPSFYIWLEEFPLTPNGKVDRLALPRPLDTLDDDYTAPAGPLESRLVSIWAELLGMEKERLSVTTDFFAAGGHSIAAMNLAARVHRQLGVGLSVADVMKCATVRRMGDFIKENRGRLPQPIPKAEEKPLYPVSPSQKGMFLVQQMDPESCVYNLAQLFEWNGEPDVEQLNRALDLLVRRHEILRTAVVLEQGQPMQRILPPAPLDIKVQRVESGLLLETLQSFNSPFDLSRAPLMKVGLFQLTDRGFFIYIIMHHIIADEFSLSLMLREFNHLYLDMDKALPEQTLQFKDYSQWLLSPPRQSRLETQEKYWMGQLSGELPLHCLPTDTSANGDGRLDGGILRRRLDSHLSQSVKRLTTGVRVSLFTLLLGVYSMTLAKFSSTGDIIVATPVAGRDYPGLDSIAGNFVNLLPLRIFPYAELQFTDYMAAVHSTALSALENSDYPFERLVGKLGLKRGRGKTPLFEAIFNMNHLNPLSMTANGDSTLTPVDTGVEEFESPFTLLLLAYEADDRIDLKFVYSKAVFQPATVEYLMDNVIGILTRVSEDRDVRLGDIRFSSDARPVEKVFDRQDDGDFDL